MRGVVRVLENGRVREHELGDSTTVGRSLENDIQILDLRSSKIHCRIMRDEHGFSLVDAGSTNGTRLNGELVTRALLYPGDVVEIGEVKIHYEGEAPQGPASSAATAVGDSSIKAASLAAPRARAAEKAAAAPAAVAPAAANPAPSSPVRSAAKAEANKQELARPEAGARDIGSAEAGRLYAKLTSVLNSNAQLLGERKEKNLLEAILDVAVATCGAERGFIILADAHGSKGGIAAARNIDREKVRRPAEKFSHSIAEEVLSSGVGIVSADASSDARFSQSMSVGDLGLRSILCAPIRSGAAGQIAGVIYLDNRFSEAVFGESDLVILGALCTQAALAIENARLFEAEQKTSAQLAASKIELEKLNHELARQLDHKQSELVGLRSALPWARKFKHPYDRIVGVSPAMQKVFETLDKVIESHVPVLIQGESGTGKELVARAIHSYGPRKDKPFVSENCAAISETLLESELFGHVRGSFTDAHADKPGLFEVADGGTLFLDEIGDMSPGMQKKLLRALQDGEVRRVGGKRAVHVDVRVIAASNKLLREMIKRGEFREDLYYRLNVITVDLPPLRARRDDIPLIVEHILDRIAEESGARRRITKEALTTLARYDWPGNVRELENELRRACALSDEAIDTQALSNELQRKAAIAVPDLAGASTPGLLPPGVGLKEYVKARALEIELQIIAATLEELGWRKSEVAERLQVSRPTLDSKIELFQLQPPESAPS